MLLGGARFLILVPLDLSNVDNVIISTDCVFTRQPSTGAKITGHLDGNFKTEVSCHCMKSFACLNPHCDIFPLFLHFTHSYLLPLPAVVPPTFKTTSATSLLIFVLVVFQYTKLINISSCFPESHTVCFEAKLETWFNLIVHPDYSPENT